MPARSSTLTALEYPRAVPPPATGSLPGVNAEFCSIVQRLERRNQPRLSGLCKTSTTRSRLATLTYLAFYLGLCPVERPHHLDKLRHPLGVGLAHDAVPQVKDMRPAQPFAQHALGFCFYHGFRARAARRGRELPLQAFYPAAAGGPARAARASPR